MNSNLGSLIKTQTFTGTVSLPGKGEGSLNMGALKVPTGYTYIGAVAIDSGYGDQFLCSFQRYGSNMLCTVKNLFLSELTGNVTCKALFLKD